MLLDRCMKHWVLVILLSRNNASMSACLLMCTPFNHVESFRPFILKYDLASLLTPFLFVKTWHLRHEIHGLANQQHATTSKATAFASTFSLGFGLASCTGRTIKNFD